MAEKKSKPIDQRSDATVLVYVGPGFISGVPAADLHGGDLARLAYVATLEHPSAKDLGALADQLEATGFYVRAGEEPSPTIEPADPAPATEG
jgi:hypothetical protein